MSQSLVASHISSTGPLRKRVSSSESRRGGRFLSAFQSGRPENNPFSNPAVPAVSACFSMLDTRDFSFFNILNIERTIKKRRNGGMVSKTNKIAGAHKITPDTFINAATTRKAAHNQIGIR